MELPAVKNILDANWDWHLPVNIEDIAGKLNIKVDYISPFDNDYRSLSGLAEINEQGERVIYCNSIESENRRRFTLAHELGHHVLRHVTPQNRRFEMILIRSIQTRLFGKNAKQIILRHSY